MKGLKGAFHLLELTAPKEPVLAGLKGEELQGLYFLLPEEEDYLFVNYVEDEFLSCAFVEVQISRIVHFISQDR